MTSPPAGPNDDPAARPGPDLSAQDAAAPPTWVCPNCGQVLFGDDPPLVCAFCHDMTTWRRLPAAGADDASAGAPTAPAR